MNTVEQEIIERALDAFEQETHQQMRILLKEVRKERHIVDAVVELQGIQFNVEIKRWVQQANFGAVVYQVQQLPGRPLLIADYVNKRLAKRLKDAGVQFIDTAGNAYIDAENLYINVRGNDPTTTLTVKDGPQLVDTLPIGTDRKIRPEQRGETGRAFTPTGMKVVFGFIRNPELIDQPYRKIAEETGVALGTVGWVIHDLKARGLIIDRGKKKQIAQIRALIQKWVQAYPQLRQKCAAGKFVADEPYWWKEFNIQAHEAQWGGEIAAAMITGDLKPQMATIYTRAKLVELVQAARLRRAVLDEEANVEILRPFWKHDERGQTVHPLIVHGDLVATGDPRNLETAKAIYERFLDKPQR